MPQSAVLSQVEPQLVRRINDNHTKFKQPDKRRRANCDSEVGEDQRSESDPHLHDRATGLNKRQARKEEGRGMAP